MKSRNVSLNCGAVEAPARAAHSGRRFVLPAFMFFALGLSVLLTGCSANFDPKLSGMEPSLTVGSFKGLAHGGQAPIYGAAIYVMQTGLSGYPGSSVAANTSLITAASGVFTGTVNGTSHGNYVLSDINGNFTINGFTCTPGAGVYLYAVGGQPIAGTTNNASTEMAAMGICPAGGASALAASVPFVNINEVSTAAMAYALGGFTAAGYDATHISSSATNSVGLSNAFTNAALLYSVGTNNGANSSATGYPVGSFGITQPKLNTIANILADCVNSNGSTSSSTTPCYILFQNATSNGTAGSGTIPTDTASAMINIVHNVQSNVSALYALASNSYAPYTPTYGSTAPSDFVLSVSLYNPNGATQPYQLGIDSTGSVYFVSDYYNGAASPTITKVTPGNGVIGTTTLSTLSNFAIDQSNNIFLVNTDGNAPVVKEYASSTTAALGSTVSGAPTFPTASAIGSYIYIGGRDSPIIVGPTNNVELLANSLGAIYNAPYSAGSYSAGTKISGASTLTANGFSIDGAGNTYYTNTSTGYIYKVSSTGTALWGTSVGSVSPEFTKVNSLGQTVVTGYNSSLSEAFYSLLSSSGSVLASTSQSTLPTLPSAPFLDGLGTMWVVGFGTCRVQAFTPVGTVTSYTPVYSGDGVYTESASPTNYCTYYSEYDITPSIDQSGDVWFGIAGGSSSTYPYGYVMEAFGLAAPTIQPLSLQSTKLLTTNTSLDIRP